MLSAQIETRLGSGEAKDSKGPDMKVWSKGKGLESVSRMPSMYSLSFSSSSRQIGPPWSSATHRSLSQNHRNRVMIFGILWSRQKITLRTRVCFWWLSECATSPIVRMLAGLSLWTLILYALLYLSVTSHSLVFQDQEAQYKLLLSLQTELLSFIKNGVATRDVYQHAINFVKQKMPDLEKHFVKNVGFSVRFFR